MANLDDENAAPFDCAVTGLGKLRSVTARTLTGRRDACNTFDAPDQVRPAPLDTRLTADGFAATLPACSVSAFAVDPA